MSTSLTISSVDKERLVSVIVQVAQVEVKFGITWPFDARTGAIVDRNENIKCTWPIDAAV